MKKENSSHALVIKQAKQTLLGPSFELHATGLTVVGTPTKEEYNEAFSRLKFIENAQSWWWGDLANAREKHYGSLKEIAERLEVDYNTLRTYQYVTNQYEPANRLYSLTFKHHMIAASQDDRLVWLEKAKENKWTTRELEVEIQKAKNVPHFPSGKYQVIYADPPWRYDNSGLKGSADSHYPTMSLDDLCRLDVGKLAGDAAVLFMWVTGPFLREGLQLCQAWGFEYKTTFVWIKDRSTYGKLGFYNYGQHEFLFIAIKGSCLPQSGTLEPSVLFAPKGKHSEKPEAVYELIEQMYSGPYIELFARKTRSNWATWG